MFSNLYVYTKYSLLFKNIKAIFIKHAQEHLVCGLS